MGIGEKTMNNYSRLFIKGQGFLKTLKLLVWYIGAKFLRIIYSTIFSCFFAIKYWFTTSFDSKSMYSDNVNEFKSLASLSALKTWAKTIYKYKWDGKYGLLDHDNWKIEFFNDYGDCDDIARWAVKKLRELGYVAWRINLTNRDKPFINGHFDCMFYDPAKPKEYYLFNYGSVIFGTSVTECLTNLGEIWEVYKNPFYFKKSI